MVEATRRTPRGRRGRDDPEEFQVSDAAGRTAKRRPAMPVETIIVVPEIWETAKRLAAGDPRRIEVLSPEVVVVRNKRIR